MEEGDGSTLMLLGNLDMDGPHDLVLELCKGCGGGGSCSRRGDGLGGFSTIPDILELEAKSNGGPSGLRQCRMDSKSSVRWCKLVCLWEWNNQPILEMKGAWIEQV